MIIYENISIVHVFNYRKERGTVNPFREFQKICKPFSPMSCMRHVHVVCVNKEDKKEAISRFIEKVTPTCESASVLTGKDAYTFMLQWSIGALSRKLFGNDHFVLGVIRQEWSKMNKNKHDQAIPFTKFMDAVLADAKRIRAFADVKMLELKKSTLPSVLEEDDDSLVKLDEGCASAIACGAGAKEEISGVDDDEECEETEAGLEEYHRSISQHMIALSLNCAASRELNLTPVYRHMMLPPEEYMRTAMPIHIADMSRMLKGMQHQSARASCMAQSTTTAPQLALFEHQLFIARTKGDIARKLVLATGDTRDRAVEELSIATSTGTDTATRSHDRARPHVARVEIPAAVREAPKL